MKTQIILTLLLLTQTVPLVQSQSLSEPNDERQIVEAKIKLLDAWLNKVQDHAAIPGISITLFDADSIIWENGYGYADEAALLQMAPDTPMRSCSISKLMTALAVMRLNGTGQLDINDDLSTHLPWFIPRDGQSGASVTLKSVLTHTSGLPTEADIPYFIEIDFPDRQQLIEDPNSKLLLSQPHTEFRYSNLGYSLLGLVIESITGKSYNQFVQDEIISGIGLENSWTDIEMMTNMDRLAQGYGVRRSNKSRAVFQRYSTEALSPAAGLITTSHDLGLFGIWALQARQKSSDLFDTSTLVEMMSPVWNDTISGYKRGLGFRYYQDDEQTFVGHGGYCSGYRSVMMFDTLTNKGVSVMINVNDESPYDIAFTAMGIMGYDVELSAQSFDLSPLEGVYDRPEMPERVAITALNDRLLVMDLFTARPDKSIWELEPSMAGNHQFKKLGEEVEADIYFSFTQSDTLFHRYYNYLIKVR